MYIKVPIIKNVYFQKNNFETVPEVLFYRKHKIIKKLLLLYVYVYAIKYYLHKVSDVIFGVFFRILSSVIFAQNAVRSVLYQSISSLLFENLSSRCLHAFTILCRHSKTRPIDNVFSQFPAKTSFKEDASVASVSFFSCESNADT